MRWMNLCALVTLTIGCTTTTSNFSEQVPAQEVLAVDADLDQGSLTYMGMPANQVTINGLTWGTGRNVDLAETRQSGNDWSVMAQNGTLQLRSQSTALMAGVDFDLTGPNQIDVYASLSDGRAHLMDVTGYAEIWASSIDLDNFYGDADLFAHSGGVDAEIIPVPGGFVRVETQGGDVYLTLPWGADLNLQVWGDPEYSMIIDDFGFHAVSEGVGYFAGVAGPGLTRVDVFATGGDVYISAGF